MEIEGFDSIISTLHLAKELHNIDRYDVVENHFCNLLCWEGYYENIAAVMSSLFSDVVFSYDDDNECEFTVLGDDVISKYFLYAHEYEKLSRLHKHSKQNDLRKWHKAPHDISSHVAQARKAVSNWLNVSSCTDWKLLAYTKTKEAARQSKLVIRIYSSCGCDASEGVAYGLIQLYDWFTARCAEMESAEIASAMKEPEDGKVGPDGEGGKDGKDGKDGNDGNDGKDGNDVKNGKDAKDGKNAVKDEVNEKVVTAA